MQELLENFTSQGLTEEQAQDSLQTIQVWLEENYPVAGAIVSSWMRSETAGQ